MRKENEESTVSVIGRLAARLILIVLSALVLFTVAGYAFGAGKDIFYQPPVEDPPGTDITLEISKETDYSALADMLVKKGAVRNGTAVAVQARLYKTELYPGTYTVNTSMTTKQILTAINENALALKEAAEAEVHTEDKVLGGGDEEGASNGK